MSSKWLLRAKAYYREAEQEASESAQFYVTGDGVMFANSTEIVLSHTVQEQLGQFESLRNEWQDGDEKKRA